MQHHKSHMKRLEKMERKLRVWKSRVHKFGLESNSSAHPSSTSQDESSLVDEETEMDGESPATTSSEEEGHSSSDFAKKNTLSIRNSSPSIREESLSDFESQSSPKLNIKGTPSSSPL